MIKTEVPIVDRHNCLDIHKIERDLVLANVITVRIKNFGRCKVCQNNDPSSSSCCEIRTRELICGHPVHLRCFLKVLYTCPTCHKNFWDQMLDTMQIRRSTEDPYR